ncbi:uncharacterized protein EI97DRAFT_171035 [Westerdykella ornata]|uniref:Uncharacterized protein n=1 Tax=Westerdykella ornata TaxID=318751 RepID=A0A6A6JRK5_WESOR|nr:uncharacterized protein EI97DRAFT_171035 [Westerdykella ornata]KAF2279260.1 hypothetical protein EI97DRAFT_171035 [Westerdykella ornata]
MRYPYQKVRDSPGKIACSAKLYVHMKKFVTANARYVLNARDLPRTAGQRSCRAIGVEGFAASFGYHRCSKNLSLTSFFTQPIRTHNSSQGWYILVRWVFRGYFGHILSSQESSPQVGDCETSEGTEMNQYEQSGPYGLAMKRTKRLRHGLFDSSILEFMTQPYL